MILDWTGASAFALFQGFAFLGGAANMPPPGGGEARIIGGGFIGGALKEVGN